jgi:hypothetical protein
MAVKKNNSFLTDSLKKDIKKIIRDVMNTTQKLTSDDIDVLTIKKTNNGYILELNDGTADTLPTTEVIQIAGLEGEGVGEDDDVGVYRQGLSELLYNVAVWSGYEFDPKSDDNLNIDFNMMGEDVVDNSDGVAETSEVKDGNFTPPTKGEILAAAMGTLADDDKMVGYEEADYESPVKSEDELKDNEWVAGDDYSVDDDDVDGYNVDFDSDNIDDGDGDDYIYNDEDSDEHIEG